MKHITSIHGIDQLVQSYLGHLLDVRGLAEATCSHRTSQVREFLLAQWKEGGGDLALGQLEGEAVLQYVARQRGRYQPISLQYLASTLRSFLRFHILTGQGPAEVLQAVPKIWAGPKVSPPDYLTETQLQTLLGSLAVQSPLGACAQALILCLAKLGLRAGEAAHLVLEDLDWRQATLRLTQTKGGRNDCCPYRLRWAKPWRTIYRWPVLPPFTGRYLSPCPAAHPYPANRFPSWWPGPCGKPT